MNARAVLSGAGVAPVVALGGLGIALAVRVHLAGADGARSPLAGIWFAAVLAFVSYLTRDPDRFGGPVGRAVLIGIAGAVVLCVPPAIRHLSSASWVAPIAAYPGWAAIVVLVAVTEESLLRGSLFTTLERRFGGAAAVAVTSLAFGLLHAPVYGWGVVPLDVTVGVWLGALRVVSGSVVAPAVAHSVADLAGWWLR